MTRGEGAPRTRVHADGAAGARARRDARDTAATADGGAAKQSGQGWESACTAWSKVKRSSPEALAEENGGEAATRRAEAAANGELRRGPSMTGKKDG